MPTRHHALLIGHGALIFILGLVAGVPFVWAIADAATGAPEAVESLRAWRMAHLEGALNGMMMFAIAASAKPLTISAKQSGLITWASCHRMGQHSCLFCLRADRRPWFVFYRL